MVIEIDFNSDEAIYVQLMNQIILGIATSRLQEGDPLPSVRQLGRYDRNQYAHGKQSIFSAAAGGICNDRPQTWSNHSSR